MVVTKIQFFWDVIFRQSFGFLFGALRGTLIVILFYLGFLYLIGKERELPDLILEAYTYQYLKNTTDALSDYFVEQVEPEDNQNKKQNLQENKL